MSSRLIVSGLLGVPILTGAVAFSGYLLLQACAISLPLLNANACKTAQQISTADILQSASLRHANLQRHIFELERELAARQCVRVPPDPNAPLTEEGWDNRDLAMLFGCWELDTTYRTRDVDTNEIRSYSKWQMCFDLQGNGTQSMQANDGTLCEGTVQGAFQNDRLSLIEPGNLACADGSYIHQRQITCAPAPQGQASCDTLQPETSGAAKVGFKRQPT